jgi:cytochrome P450
VSTPQPTTPTGEPWPTLRTPWPEPSAPLYGKEFERDPFAYYEHLRQTFGPVVPVTLDEAGALRGYLVLDHGYQLDVLQDRDQLWTRDSRWYRDLAEGALPPDHPLIPQFAYRRSRLYAEGAEHARLSGPGDKALAELDLLRTRDLVEDLAEQLIAGLIPELPDFTDVSDEESDEESGERPDSEAPPPTYEADILHGYATQLPLLVMMRLMGMDEDSALATGNAIHEMLSGGPGAHRAAAELDARMLALVTEKRDDPGPDLVSWMHHHNRETGLDPHELSEEVWLQIVSGYGASTSWICNTVLELLTDPTLNEDVSAERCTMAEAMNHVMWVNAPIQNLIGRWATRATTLAGFRIDAGDMAIVSIGATGANPAMRSVRSAGSDVSRTNKAHLAWGAGTHRCPARELGSLIVRTALECLWDRLPGMRLAVPKDALSWTLPYIARSPTALPVAFPRPPAEPKDHKNGEHAEPWTRRHQFISTPPQPISTASRARRSGRQGRLPRWRSLVAWWPRR